MPLADAASGTLIVKWERETVSVATQFVEAVGTSKRIDDSEFENFNGQLVKRPVPKEEHAEIQLLMTNLLVPLAKQVGGKALQELSISDDASHWLTPMLRLLHRILNGQKIIC